MSDLPLAQATAVKQRLLSLDALRGLDMLCIMGLEDIIREIARIWENPVTHTLAEQFEHVPWAGLHAYDMIFPLFMFLSGFALPLSMDVRVERGDSRLRLWGKIGMRCGVLVLLGLIYNGVFSLKPVEPRYASVLAQIGLAWGISASLHLVVRSSRGRWITIFAWLASIAILHLLVPVPGYGAAILTESGSINAWFDRQFLPGRLHGVTFDPEGLLSILFAVPLTMAGALAGGFMKKHLGQPWKFVSGLAVAGAISVAAGAVCWALGYPPVKALWTVTFDLFAIGISALLLALFYAVIDVLRWQSWSFPLRVIGMNSITIYIGSRLISFPEISDFLFGRASWGLGEAAPLFLLCGVLLLEWLVLYFFYRRGWFLRV